MRLLATARAISIFRSATLCRPAPSARTRRAIPTIRTAMSSLSRPSSSASAASTAPAPASTPAPTEPPKPKVNFALSPVPPNPLGEGKYIRSAAALIIGDEILNGKTLDRNSHFFAQYCFEHGIELKRIEVVADKEDEIIEASRRMVQNYDFVITSGGIGPTHDDITYESLAKSFDQPLVHNEETIKRMNEMNKYRKWTGTQNAQQLAATHRMALFPEKAEVIFVGTDFWVPVVRLAGKLCVFPGIPALFQKMLTALTPFLPLPPKHERPLRIQIFTERPESMIAPYLTALQIRLKPHGIQVGSYPVLYKGVFVSLIGRDIHTEGAEGSGQERVWLADVAREVEREIEGRVASEEEVLLQKRRSAEALKAAANEIGEVLSSVEKAKF